MRDSTNSFNIVLPRYLPNLFSVKESKFQTYKFSQNFYKLRDECLEKGKLFEDPEFSCSDNSLLLGDDDIGPVEWKRPKELVRNPKFTVNGISRFDIKQGKVGDCWFLSTIASLTLHPEIIDRVVPSDQSFDTNYAGIFHFRFWYYGKWVDIVVDDRLPVLKYGGHYLAFNYSSEKNEFWSALLEKAYAKLYGSYGALIGGFPDEAMENLTGGIVEKYLLDMSIPDSLFQIIVKSFESSTIVACGIFYNSKELKEKGLIAAHAYSITAAIVLNVKGVNYQLLRVRNPWGNYVEWNGPWSDRSPEWNSVSVESRRRLGLRKDEDGEFWMSFKDFCKYFDIVEICHFSPEQGFDRKWKEIVLNGNWGHKKNPHYKMKITTNDDQPKNVIIALMQKNIREEKKDSLRIGFDVYKCQISSIKKRPRKDYYSDLERILPESPNRQYSGFREECDRFQVASGIYYLALCTKESASDAEYVLRILFEGDSNLEILGPKAKAPLKDRIYKRGKKLFKKMCGPDEEIGWQQLQTILTTKQGSNKCFPICSEKPVNLEVDFPEKLCRVLVSSFDRNYSGKLNKDEFICLWRDLWQWKDIFDKCRKTSFEYELSPYELRSALIIADVSLSEKNFDMLSGKNEMISFADSLIYAFQLEMKGVARRVLETSV